MAISLVTSALLIGAFVALLCAVVFALSQNKNHQNAIAKKNAEIEELKSNN